MLSYLSIGRAGILGANLGIQYGTGLMTAVESGVVKEANKKRLKYEMWMHENIAIGLFKEKENRKDEMFRGLTADNEGNIVPIRKLKSAHREWK
jgi:hypothetical protein